MNDLICVVPFLGQHDYYTPRVDVQVIKYMCVRKQKPSSLQESWINIFLSPPSNHTLQMSKHCPIRNPQSHPPKVPGEVWPGQAGRDS